MKTKKNPKSNLENYSKIFMQLGLFLALFVTYFALGQKTFDGQFGDLGGVTMNANLGEETSITKRIEPETLLLLTPEKMNIATNTITEKFPTFPGCDENDKKCFDKKVQKHFAVNFNTKLPKKIGLKPGEKRITVLFKIDKKGNVANIKVNAPHEKLKEESIRIANLLPKMIPGEKDGKPVGVKYTLSMRIDVEE